MNLRPSVLRAARRQASGNVRYENRTGFVTTYRAHRSNSKAGLTLRLMLSVVVASVLLLLVLAMGGCWSSSKPVVDPMMPYRTAMKDAYQSDFDLVKDAPRYEIEVTLDPEEPQRPGGSGSNRRLGAIVAVIVTLTIAIIGAIGCSLGWQQTARPTTPATATPQAIAQWTEEPDTPAAGAADAVATATANRQEPDDDGDGLSNRLETDLGTRPDAKDTDGDGLYDGQELYDVGTDPLQADSDEDWLSDGDEGFWRTDPLLADSDGDSLPDGVEVYLRTTNPIKADTDGDGLLDADDPDPAGAPRPTPTPPAISTSGFSYDPSHPAVDFFLNQVHLVRHDREKLVCVSRAGLNGLNQRELEDGNVLGPYQGDYRWIENEGIVWGNVLFRYINGKIVVIREEPWERFPGGQVYLSLEEAIDMLERGQIFYLEGAPRGVPECD